MSPCNGDVVQAPAAKEIWPLWLDQEPRAPAINMAIDELLLNSASDRTMPIARFYRWDRPAATIGYFQAPSAVTTPELTVIRRITGGGVVDHREDFTYTVVIPKAHHLCRAGRLESYRFINHLLAIALRALGVEAHFAVDDIPRTVPRATMVCFVTPTRYDLTGPAGKIAGAAQRRTAAGILHQGSVMPANAGISRSELRDALSSRPLGPVRLLPHTDPPADAILDQATVLAAEKYSRQAWNRAREQEQNGPQGSRPIGAS